MPRDRRTLMVICLLLVSVIGCKCKPGGKSGPEQSVIIDLDPATQALKDCDEGDKDQCRALATMYYKGEGTEVNMKGAFLALEMACDLEDAQCCNQAGNMISDGDLGDPEYDKIVPLYEKGCDGGIMDSCHNLSILYLGGELEGGNEAAYPWMVKACERGGSMSCRNLGAFHDKGIVVEKDHAKAHTFIEKACGMDDATACLAAGRRYKFGNGVEIDLDKSKEFLKKSCDLGEKVACAE